MTTVAAHTPHTQRTRLSRVARTVDYHTAGEPFRIVADGVPLPPGDTVAARRHAALTRADGGKADDVRRLLCSEPRGHADMYGCFVVPPDAVPDGEQAAALGVLFWHKDGFSTACGHGTIALATWALDEGVVAAPADGVTTFAVDVPSGRLQVDARREAGRVVDVSFTNVPAWVSTAGLTVPTSLGPVEVAVCFGGAFYASVQAASLGLGVRARDLPRLIAASREIRAFFAEDAAARAAVSHPDDERLSGLYGSIWFEEVAAAHDPPVLHQRNVTVFADGEVDRSPCGSGTSARLAVLHAQSRLGPAHMLWHDSIVGTRFQAWVTHETTTTHGVPAVVTVVRGSAHRTGEHTFLLDPHDPLPEGFVLR